MITKLWCLGQRREYSDAKGVCSFFIPIFVHGSVKCPAAGKMRTELENKLAQIEKRKNKALINDDEYLLYYIYIFMLATTDTDDSKSIIAHITLYRQIIGLTSLTRHRDTFNSTTLRPLCIVMLHVQYRLQGYYAHLYTTCIVWQSARRLRLLSHIVIVSAIIRETRRLGLWCSCCWTDALWLTVRRE